MSTTATTPALEPLEMETRRGVELLKFEENTIVEGLILAAREKELPDEKTSDHKKSVLCFLVQEREGARMEIPTGRMVEFPRSADLTTKLLASDVGRLVRIRCTGSRSMSGDRAPMKLFDVSVSKTVTAPPNAITDEDIPF